tara:strand:+ start:1259 stop:1945 length:687 start_codon:yes stop_codon:yes gene_type:complete
MKYFFILILFAFSSCKTEEKKFLLKKGDILFQDLDSSPLCDAIELVTKGYDNRNFSHIGIVVETGDLEKIKDPNYNYNNDVRVLEAIPDQVVTTKLDSFIYRSVDKNNNPKVIVGRLKPEYSNLIDDAIIFLKSKLGVPYDNHFLLNNASYYCSELIYEAFKKEEIFDVSPMTFLHPKDNDTLEIWKEYYKKLESELPQNKLGTNPGKMSLSSKIDIIYFFGEPSKSK